VPTSDLILAARFKPELVVEVVALLEDLGGSVVVEPSEWPGSPPPLNLLLFRLALPATEQATTIRPQHTRGVRWATAWRRSAWLPNARTAWCIRAPIGVEAHRGASAEPEQASSPASSRRRYNEARGAFSHFDLQGRFDQVLAPFAASTRLDL
jgi:hypothetical protein